MKTVFVLFLFSIAFSLTGRSEGKPAVAITAGDSLKKYPITDPRNPDCPCHKYQQQADEEYKELMKKEKEELQHAKATGGFSFFFKQKRLKKKSFSAKHHKRKKKRFSVTDCSHW